MQIYLHLMVIYSYLSIISTESYIKPSFYPYCKNNQQCEKLCNCEIAPKCLPLLMDETIRNGILYYHNQIRDIQSGTDPYPSGMTVLEYDMELEEVSKCLSAICSDEHSHCFKTRRFAETSQSVGQLILDEGETPKVFLWMQMMNYWLGQARNPTLDEIQDLPGGDKGEQFHNYAQLMSDKIRSIGCAWSLADNWLTFVCTYGPRGAIRGEPIFKDGYPCSLCPVSFICDYIKPFERLCKPMKYSKSFLYSGYGEITTEKATLPPYSILSITSTPTQSLQLSFPIAEMIPSSSDAVLPQTFHVMPRTTTQTITQLHPEIYPYFSTQYSQPPPPEFFSQFIPTQFPLPESQPPSLLQQYLPVQQQLQQSLPQPQPQLQLQFQPQTPLQPPSQSQLQFYLQSQLQTQQQQTQSQQPLQSPLQPQLQQQAQTQPQAHQQLQFTRTQPQPQLQPQLQLQSPLLQDLHLRQQFLTPGQVETAPRIQELPHLHLQPVLELQTKQVLTSVTSISQNSEVDTRRTRRKGDDESEQKKPENRIGNVALLIFVAVGGIFIIIGVGVFILTINLFDFSCFSR
ncbi:hypothetical protein HHI36_012445 [Cryptolaemus montrouzieri]|uniref:SCP domain-containing protein n=1 Tax=Cryptolaemus montrouzieri TaxID=559131 RepID=A0ABD2NEH7_9CUCU